MFHSLINIVEKPFKLKYFVFIIVESPFIKDIESPLIKDMFCLK